MFNTLYTFAHVVLKPYVQSGFFDRVEALVLSFVNEDMTGSEKRENVFNWLKAEYNVINTVLINLAIELAVVKVAKIENLKKVEESA